MVRRVKSGGTKSKVQGPNPKFKVQSSKLSGEEQGESREQKNPEHHVNPVQISDLVSDRRRI
jgi:hypothetical protein